MIKFRRFQMDINCRYGTTDNKDKNENNENKNENKNEKKYERTARVDLLNDSI